MGIAWTLLWSPPPCAEQAGSVHGVESVRAAGITLLLFVHSVTSDFYHFLTSSFQQAAARFEIQMKKKESSHR